MINGFIPGKIAVLDTFRPEFPWVDVNGDECPDIPHGEASIHYVKSGLKGDSEVIPFEVGEVVNNKGKLEEKISVGSILAQLTKIEKRDDITHIALISNSGSDLSKYLSKEAKKELLDTRLEPPLTTDEIQENRNICRTEYKKTLTPNGEVKLFLKKLEDIGKTKNKKIFCCTGNYGKDYLGLNAMADNTTLVSYVDGAFKKHSLTTDNQFVDVFAKGVFESRPIWRNGVIAGYDITEDGKIDVPIEQIAGYETIQKFQGKTAEEATASKKDYMEWFKKQKEMGTGSMEQGFKLFPQDKLISMDILSDIGYVDKNPQFAGFYTEAKTLIDMFTCETDEDYKKHPKIFFKVQNGKMVYDSPWKKKIYGASSGTPVALNQVYNEDVARARLNLKA